jgi:RNA polymerase sigma factor (sigma-70 family)
MAVWTSASEEQAYEARDELARVLAALPERDRELLSLALAGRTIREIGEYYGVSYGAIAVRLHRLRLRVAKFLAKTGPTPAQLAQG